MAAEDETTAVGRRGGSGRGRKQPIGKKDPNNHSAGNKKNSDIVKTIYSSDENSSEVSFEVDYYYIYNIYYKLYSISGGLVQTQSHAAGKEEKKSY